MKKSYWLDPRDKPALLVALMHQLAGNAHIVFEGDQEDMESLDFSPIRGIFEGLVTPFNNEWREDSKSLVLPLTNDTIRQILDVVLPEDRIIHNVGAIQIEKDGQVQFMAGDNFHNECVSVGPAVPEQLLKDLVASGILKAYQSAEQ